MKRVLLFISVFVFLFLPTVVFGKVIYDKKLKDSCDMAVLRGVPADDGGYSVLGFYEYPGFMLIKYSENGEQQWSKIYNVNTIENTYNIDISNFDIERRLIGFTQLDNGNYIVVTPTTRWLLSGDGSILSIVPMDEKYRYYTGFRCENNGDSAICIGMGDIGEAAMNGNLLRINGSNNTIDKSYDIPLVDLIPSVNDLPKVGMPVSFFINREGNYVLQTLEGLKTYLYTFDGNLKQLSKDEISINESKIVVDITNEDVYGDVYWILGQLDNNNYVGAYISYKGSHGFSSAKYVILDSSLKSVVKEKEIASADFVINNMENVSDDIKAQLSSCAYLTIVGLANGFRDGRYVSTFDVSYIETYRRPTSYWENDITPKYAFDKNDIGAVYLGASSNYWKMPQISFMRLDSELNSFDNLVLGNTRARRYVSIENDTIILSMLSSIIRLKNDDDIVLTNFMVGDGSRTTTCGRHIRIGKRFVATAVPKSSSDVAFEKDTYEPGNVVKMQLRQKEGYYIDKVIVRDETGRIIPVDFKEQTFIMPDSDVTVEVQYKKIEQVKTGIFTSIVISLVSLVLLAISNIKYFRNKKVN